jgi:hypothetical protein
MSHQCDFCEHEFTTRRSLLRHQKTALYCLTKQKEQGVDISVPDYACSCGQTFRLNHHLTQHRLRCDSTSASIVQNTQNIGTQNNLTNNLTINIYGSTASNLTAEAVAKKVMDAITVNAIEAGVAEMTREVAPSVFRNEKGIWNLRVADASRKKLVVRTDNGEETDRQGNRTARILRGPFLRASRLALTQGRRRKVENTIEEIQNDDTYERETLGALLKIAPDQFTSLAQDDGKDEDEDEHMIVYRKESAEADLIMDESRRKKIEDLRRRTTHFKEDFLNNSQNLHDGTFWHPIHRFIIQQDEKLDFIV